MVAGALALAGCGGGGGGGAPAGNGGVTQMSAYDTAAAAIAAATTAAEVDSAVAGAVAKVSGADLRRLETAAAARRTALATMARATAQRKALMEAAGGIDTSDLSDAERIAAAKAAIAALKAALDGAADVSDADRATYRTKLAAAQTAVDRQEQLNAVMGASMTLAAALGALSDAGSTPTAAQVTAAEEALAALNAAVAAGGHLTEAQKARYGSEADQAPARIASAKTLLDAEDLRRENERVAGIVEDITDTEIAAAMTAVGVVTDMSGDGDVTAAQGAIDAARARIDGADIPDGSRQMLLTALAKHEGSLDRAKASRLAYQKRMADEAEATRIARIVKDITDTEIAAAMTAVGVVTLTSDAGTVTAAEAAIEAATAEIDGASIPADEKARLRLLVAGHQGVLNGKKLARLNNQKELDRIAKVVKAITDGEIAAVGTAVGKITNLSEGRTVTDVDDAIAAAREAITDAKIPAANKAVLRTSLAEQVTAFGAAKTKRAEGARTGAALHAAMGPPDAVPTNAPAGTPLNALYNLATVPYYITRIADSGNDTSTVKVEVGQRTDFRIDPAEGAGSFATADVHTAVFFRHGVHDKAMPRVAKTGVKPAVKTVVAEDRHEMDVGNEWYVTHYERTTGSGEAKVTDRVRVYNDRVGGPDRFRGHVIEWDAAAYFEANPKTWTGLGTYDKAKREVSLGTNIVDIMIASPVFDRRTGGAVGSVTLTPADGASPSDPTEVMVPGTYMGADGHYVCESACTIGRAVGGGPYGGYSLSANWRFVHKKGAKALLWDPDYMYFGWWARDDDDGMPAAVSAFYDVRGGGIDLAPNGTDLAGSATYKGPAVGQYAIHDPDNGKGDGGEFTATATLRAEFNTRSLNPQSGMSGTVDGFRLRSRSGIGAGEWRDPAGGWSVSLNRSDWVTGTVGGSPAYASGAPKGHTDNKARTTWTVGGVAGAPAGSWVATLYDESAGTVAEGGDQSSHPTSAMGKFQAERGGTHRMVGAFGARLQPE